MVLNPEKQARVEEKIAGLRNREAGLKAQLKQVEEDHAIIWGMYGSELCGGDMVRQEHALQCRIDEIAGDIALLTQFATGEISLADIDNLQARSEELQREIRMHEIEKEGFAEALKPLLRIKTLLA